MRLCRPSQRPRRALARDSLPKTSLYDHECTACPLHAHALTVCMAASGSPSLSKILVVGEAPGATEDRLGTPFVGYAGGILDKALIRIFGDNAREKIRVTNAVKCRPVANRNPTHTEVTTCVDLFLAREIKRFNPFVILALGNISTEALLGLSGIGDLRGTWWPLDSKKERWVMPTWHPAYIGYQGGVGSARWDEFLSDVMLVKEREDGQ